jgi:uncharacterized protein
MRISQTVLLRSDRRDVWALFQDTPEIATCMPGAELTEVKGDNSYAGRVTIKLGPFNASFEGEVEHRPDPETFSGRAEGRGVDKRGGSRSRMAMDYALTEVEEGTSLAIEADVQLSGPIAQFGRPAIVTETARMLIDQFVANVEAKLAGTEAGAPRDLNALALGGRVVGASVRRWLGKENGG